MMTDSDEDVQIILSHDHRYKFHRSVLVRNSTFFASLLTNKSAAPLSPKALKAGVKIKWIIALTKVPDFDVDSHGTLELLQLNGMGEPLDNFSGMILNENGRIPTPAFKYYENIFYALYNSSTKLISDASLDQALTDACHILDICEYLGCIPVISKPIDVALAKRGQDLYVCIQSKPWAWVALAYRIKSELIFKEAIVHLAGDWRKMKGNAEVKASLATVPSNVRCVIEQHHKILVSRGKKLEFALSSLYPGDMATPSMDFPIKREEYSKDILVWMALAFFRHWFGQKIISEKGALAPDSGFELYGQIGRAGEAYMDKTVLNQFHKKFPMTKKAMNVLENHLLEIKECMKGIVDRHAVLKSNCLLDTHRFPVDYLTCAIVDRGDLPWVAGKDGDGEEGEKGRNGDGRRLGGNEIVKRNLEAQRKLAAAGTVRGRDEFEEDEEDEAEGMEDVLKVISPEKGRGKRARFE
ncbi:hypothetical protein K491DRAFT_79558 [Lophiostoma macrostomum CBS 122681]|uniref:BTB domain-containing protein n=1 Tax=Lophiostoma macrostomum CBS 122681 TaxID=1314788 RepID=A0A6A6TJZ6_9PLEO|nr:hypothetical protein K491DRAFT_79558 [Lophiostoma macrostomum CBS 122681]